MRPFDTINEVFYPKGYWGDTRPYKKEIGIDEMHDVIADSKKVSEFYQMLGEDISNMYDSETELDKVKQRIEFCIKTFYEKHFEVE